MPITRNMSRRKETNERKIKDGARIEIPKEFRYLPFFKESMDSITYHTDQSFEDIIQNTYFIFDIERQDEPWNEIENSIPVLLNLWKSKHEDIATLFRNRNKQEAEGPMILLRHICYRLYIG